MTTNYVLDEITVVIPVHPPRIRNGMLRRALDSVWSQTLLPDAVIIERDSDHQGSAITRTRALAKVTTRWVAFLDSDDEFLPTHLSELLDCALNHEADVVYPGCHVIGGSDPHDRFGHPFDADLLRKKSYIPVTSLVKTFFAQDVGGFTYPEGSIYDDWGFYLKLLDEDAQFIHHPVKTWNWHHTGISTPDKDGNTSGQAHKWWTQGTELM